MTDATRNNRSLYINLLIFLLISAVCLYALFRQTPFETPAQLPGIDKAVHVTLFFLLAGHLLQWVKGKTAKWVAIGSVLGFALFSEWAQARWLPLRDYSQEDAMANIAGVMLGIGVYWIVKKNAKNMERYG